MIKQVLAAAALAAYAATALAADNAPFYLGADVGTSKFDGLSDRQTSYGAVAGYQFNPYVGAELSYRRLGDVTVRTPTSATNGNVEQSAISVIGTLPVGNGFGLLARYGRTQLKQHGNNVDSERGDGALFGLGVQYAYTPALALRLEAQKPAKGVDNVSASLLFNF